MGIEHLFPKGVLMKTRDLEKISFTPFKPSRTMKKHNKPLMSIDTETDSGKAFLLCSYRDGDIADYVEIDTAEDWLEYFFQKDFRKYLITGWNMKYDFNALISHLPSYVLESMAYYDYAQYDQYSNDEYVIRNFGNKFFRITKGHKNVNFYDMAQFYRESSTDSLEPFQSSSLNSIAQQFLGLQKEDVDREHITKAQFDNDSEYHDKLISYCVNDAYLTYRLSKLFFSELDTALPFVDYSKPISPAYFSAQLMRQTLPANQTYPDNVNEMLLKAYKGGRFETIQKGHFEDVYEYDLSSAYPSVMRDYLFSFDGSWFFTREYHKEMLYGIYEVLVSIEEDDLNSVCPLPITSHEGLLIYPNGKIHAFIIKPELEFLERNGYNVEILKGYEYMAKDEPRALLKELIEHLYAQKQQFKHSNKIRYMLYKIIINSLYGKTLQLTENSDIEESDDISAEHIAVLPDLSVKPFNKKPTNYRAGGLFNLYLASYITAQTRIQLFEFTKRYESEIISYATDGVYMLKDLSVSGNGLGTFDKEKHDEGIVYGNGLYIMGGKEKTRGLMKHVFSNPRVKREYERDVLKFTYDKPIQLKEAVRQNRLQDFNVFKPYTKKLSLNNDHKRIFPNVITFEDITKKSYGSYPLTVDEHYDDEKNLSRVMKYQNEIAKDLERVLIGSDYWDSSLEDDENLRILKPSLKDILYRET